MKNKANKETILQIVILIACFVIMAFNHSKIFINAQTTCSGPSLTDPIYPQRFAWRQNAQVSLVIYDTSNTTDFLALDFGIREWNNHKATTCSNVTINPAVDGESPVPSGT